MAHIATLRLLLSGLAAGDSIGSTSEFMPQSRVATLLNPHKADPHAWPLRQVGGGPFGWDAGASTDDTDMAYAMVPAIVQGLTGDDFTTSVACGFVDWYNTGPRDIGSTTRTMLRKVKRRLADGQSPSQLWIPAIDAASANCKGWSNGALMRNGVAAAINPEQYDQWNIAFERTMQHTLLTHACALPVLCNLVHTIEILRGQWGRKLDMLNASAIHTSARHLSAGQTPAVKRWRDQFSSPDEMHYEIGGAVRVLESALSKVNSGQWNPFDESDGKFQHQGYCVLTLQVAYWIAWASIDSTRGEDQLPAWVPDQVKNLTGPDRLAWVGLIGHDADTYGAVAGPLVAAYHGRVPDFLTHNLKALEAFDRRYDPVKESNT